jgi:hypothetical protein
LVAWSKSARQAHGSHHAATGRQNPALVSCSLSRQRSAGRREKLAVSGRGGVETPVRWRHTVLPWQHATRCGAHGCSSLKMWVASVGRTRLGHFRIRDRKIARRWPNSGGAEAPSTEASRSKSSESARENCSPRVDNRASRSSSEVKASLSPGTTEGASDRSGSRS